MGTPQIKLSGGPSLLAVQPKVPKDVKVSFADTLKPIEQTEKTSETPKEAEAEKLRSEFSEKSEHFVADKNRTEKKEIAASAQEGSCATTGRSTCHEKQDVLLLASEEDKNKEALMSLLSGLISNLSLKLGVKEDDIKDFITSQGLQPGELLDINTWKVFTLNLHKLEDASQLLTDEGAFGDYKMVSDLLKSLVNTSEMKQITAGLTEGSEEFKVFLNQYTEVLPRLTENVENEKVVTEAPSFVKEVSEGEGVVIKPVLSSEEGLHLGTGSEERTEREAFSGKEMPVISQANRVFENLSNAIGNLKGSERLPEGMSERELLSQVTESIKTLHAPDRTTLELMLQPASLGKVLINVTSKNGVMQAQLRVESPEARQALLNNIADLKVSFESQGFKVEEIEVMLAETGIGQQDRENQSHTDEKKNKGRSGKITFAEEEVSEVSSAEDEMLYAGEVSGASVDYSA